MKLSLSFIFITVMLIACGVKTENAESVEPVIPLVGTWELISGTSIVKEDTSFTDYQKNQKMIKIINPTHFAFLRHDLNKGKDSAAIFVSGGGRYSLRGDQYTEYLDFCNDREWEGQNFHFTVLIKNDTLIQSGKEKIESQGIDRLIIEKYARVKD